MKRLLLSCVSAVLMLSAFAQPAGDIFPDFTYTDLEGTEHHLQSYLDEGKTVVIDVFATWCPVCQSSVGGLEELYHTYGQAGDGSMVVLSFERDPNTSNEAQYAANFGVESPIITGATDLIAAEWNITYQPRYFVVCPDGTFQSELVTPIYNDPQPLIDLSEECEISTGLGSSELESEFTLINSSFNQVLHYQSSVDGVQYRILDLTGAQSQEGRLNVGRGSLELSSLQQGMYLLHLTDGKSVLTKRIIKRS